MCFLEIAKYDESVLFSGFMKTTGILSKIFFFFKFTYLHPQICGYDHKLTAVSTCNVKLHCSRIMAIWDVLLCGLVSTNISEEPICWITQHHSLEYNANNIHCLGKLKFP
jgi:hypothetical protein